RQSREGDQQREERQAGNGVEHARKPGHRREQPRQLPYCQTEQEGQREADRDCNARQNEVLAYAYQDVWNVAERPIPKDERLAGPHATAVASDFASDLNAAPSVSTVTTPAYRPWSSTTTAVWTADASIIDSASRRVVSRRTSGDDASTCSVPSVASPFSASALTQPCGTFVSSTRSTYSVPASRARRASVRAESPLRATTADPRLTSATV